MHIIYATQIIFQLNSNYNFQVHEVLFEMFVKQTYKKCSFWSLPRTLLTYFRDINF